MGVINWDDLAKTAKEATELLPDGDYDIVVDSAEAVTASTGSPMIKVVMHITDGPYSKSKRKLFTNLVLSPDSGFALTMLFDKLRGLGITQDVFDRGAGLDEIAALLKNAKATAVVGKGKPFGTPPRQNNEITSFKHGQLDSEFGHGAINTDAFSGDAFAGGIEF